VAKAVRVRVSPSAPIASSNKAVNPNKYKDYGLFLVRSSPLRAIDGFTGSFSTRSALRLAAPVFVRPGNLRHAERAEIDFEKAEWRIPAGKRKIAEQHIVPLSVQAIAILPDSRTGDLISQCLLTWNR